MSTNKKDSLHAARREDGGGASEQFDIRARRPREEVHSYDNMQLRSAHFRSRICNDERGALSAH